MTAESLETGGLMRRLAFGAAGAMLLAFAPMPALGQCNPAQQVEMIASDAAAGDFFSCSVALSGDTAVVGAFGDDHAGGTDAGSAYVFHVRCCCAGDMNGDGTVDGNDIQLFVDKLLSGGACP